MSDQVTIVVRTRNRPVMLGRALASIAAQTYSRYQVIVVNDAGDETPVRDVIASLDAPVRERISLITNKVSHGREAALETGLAASHLTYFAVHDDDDTWHPHFLQDTVAYLEAHPEAGGVATRCEIVRERVRADGSCVETSRELLATDNLGLSLIDTLVDNYAPPISQLIRRDVADRIGHWDGSLLTQADWEFNLRLLAATPVGFLDGDALAYWHHRDTADQNLGNSVVTDARAHQWDNVAIRDRYLRSSLASSSPKDPHLGGALLAAEYYRRLRHEMTRMDGGYHQALNLVHVDMLNTMTALHQQVHELRGEVTALREQIDASTVIRRQLRRTLGAPIRVLRRLRHR